MEIWVHYKRISNAVAQNVYFEASVYNNEKHIN